MATLTGACVAALGKNYTGAFTNSQDFLQELEKYSQKTGEKLWQLPIDEDFHKQVLESNVADMNNCVIGVGAGSSLAAAFLEEFVDEGVEWIHLDIAGSSDFSEGKPYMAKGATGVLLQIVRSLITINLIYSVIIYKGSSLPFSRTVLFAFSLYCCAILIPSATWHAC